ncbi:hypothetical protein BaRGS_00017662, partial [Batillaria attramentaria]
PMILGNLQLSSGCWVKLHQPTDGPFVLRSLSAAGPMLVCLLGRFTSHVYKGLYLLVKGNR